MTVDGVPEPKRCGGSNIQLIKPRPSFPPLFFSLVNVTKREKAHSPDVGTCKGTWEMVCSHDVTFAFKRVKREGLFRISACSQEIAEIIGGKADKVTSTNLKRWFPQF